MTPGILYGLNGGGIKAVLAKNFQAGERFEAMLEIIGSNAMTCSLPHGALSLQGYIDLPNGCTQILYLQPQESLAMWLTSESGEDLRASESDWVR